MHEVHTDFYERIKKIAESKNKVKLFVDMDGTIVEYNVFKEGVITTSIKGAFSNNRPLYSVLNELEKIASIPNVEIYILSLCRSNIIEEEKNEWLDKYAPFFKKENRIIVNREKGQYSPETRLTIKAEIIKKNLNNDDYGILLDDDHKILHEAQKQLQSNGEVFHVSSVIAGF